ncbi:MAG TPA: metallophosphoesterase family protein [Fulvivirga sp.]|nr:metallophosphoesterase family protein [Fulvivirga sp.]
MIRKLKPILFLILILSALYGCDGETDAEYYNAMVDPPLKLIRSPYLQNNIADSVTIAWKTTKTAKSCYIEFGTGSSDMVRKVGIVEPQRINTMNYVTLHGLEPFEKYYYKVYTNETLLAEGEEYYFYSAQSVCDQFSFIAVADVGQPPSWHGHFDETMDQISKMKVKPDLGLVLGDIVYPDGESEKADDYFFKKAAPLMRNTPVFAILGNHDHKSPVDVNFKQEWILPNNEHYYSFDYGTAHFIGLDSGDDSGLYDKDNQLDWLENDLKEAQGKYDWTVVFLHHHGRTCSYKIQESDVIGMYPLFVKYGIDLVLNGHIHTYERLKPLDSLGNVLPAFSETEFVYPDIKDGFISVTAGTSGRPSSWEPNGEGYCKEGIVTRAIHELAFARVEIDKQKLFFELISSENGDVLDHFTIDKGL